MHRRLVLLNIQEMSCMNRAGYLVLLIPPVNLMSMNGMPRASDMSCRRRLSTTTAERPVVAPYCFSASASVAIAVFSTRRAIMCLSIMLDMESNKNLCHDLGSETLQWGFIIITHVVCFWALEKRTALRDAVKRCVNRRWYTL